MVSLELSENVVILNLSHDDKKESSWHVEGVGPNTNIETTLRSLVCEQFLTKSSKLGFTLKLFILYTKHCNSFPDNDNS